MLICNFDCMWNKRSDIVQVLDKQPAKKLLAWTAAGSKNNQKCTKKGHFLGSARKGKKKCPVPYWESDICVGILTPALAKLTISEKGAKKENLKKTVDQCFPCAKPTFATRRASAERCCIKHPLSKVNEKPAARSKILKN